MSDEYWVLKTSGGEYIRIEIGYVWGTKRREIATRYVSREAASRELVNHTDLGWRIVRVRKVKRKPVPGMRITITREQLVDLGACEPGLKWFDSIAPNGVWSSEWTPLHDVWIRKSEWCGWLLDKKLIPIANFYEANLRGADLQGADLQGANLEGADLQGADLRGAALARSNLEEANLRFSYLRGADLRGANLQCANLRVADLYRADLGGANLQGAYLQGVDLRWANLRGANLYRADLEGANLYMADLQGAYLQGADLGDWERGPDGLARRKT